MKNKLCDPVVLSAFADGELDRQARANVQQHLAQCRQCQTAHDQIAALSTAFQDTLRRHYPGAALAALDGKLIDHWYRYHHPSWIDRCRRTIFSKWMLVPVTAFVAAVFVMLPLRTAPPVAQSPSAIVQSISGDLASVMIMQTPMMEQTVIWISESDDHQDNTI